MFVALLLALGTALIVAGMCDQFWTILGEGGGPMTQHVARRVWMGSRRLYRAWPRTWVLSAGGVAAVLATVGSWVGLQWAGWSLVFLGLDGGVIGPSGETAGLAERVYYAGYLLSTLGLGDVRPDGPAARILTTGASLTGLFQVSFAVGYLIPLIVAATDKRRVAIYVSCLGASSTDVLTNAWDGESMAPLAEWVRRLTPELALLEQRHRAYPILLYLHSQKRAGAIGPSVAVLDETLTTVTLGLDADRMGGPALHPGEVHAHRRMLSTLIETLAEAAPEADAEVPPPPSLAPLREVGLPTVSDAVFADRLSDLADRRRTLRQLVQFDGWAWEAVATPDAGGREALTALYETSNV